MNNEISSEKKIEIFLHKVNDLLILKNKINLEKLADGGSVTFSNGSLTNLHFTNLNVEKLTKESNNFDKVRGYLFNIRIFILEKDFVSFFSILDVLETLGLDSNIIDNYKKEYNIIMNKKLIDDLYREEITPILDMFNIDKNSINIKGLDLIETVYYGGEVHINDMEKYEKYENIKKNIDEKSGTIGTFILTHLIVILIELTDLLENVKDFINKEYKK